MRFPNQTGTARRAPARVAAGVLLSALTLAAGAFAGAPAQAHPGPPEDVFDPDVVSWVSTRDRTPSDFNESLSGNRAAGRIPVDIDADASGSSYRLAAVYQRNLDDRDWQVLHGLTESAYSQAWSNAAANGMRLVDYETYVLDGVRYHNGLWIQNVEGYSWTSQRNMTFDQWQDYQSGQRGAGRLIVDFDHYETGSGARYAAVAVGNGDDVDWSVSTGLSTTGLGTVTTNNSNLGRRPLVAESVLTGGVQRYAGIFVTNSNDRDWAMEHDLTASEYALVWSAYGDAGFRLVGFERYDTADGVRYLGIWRQND